MSIAAAFKVNRSGNKSAQFAYYRTTMWDILAGQHPGSWMHYEGRLFNNPGY